MSWPLTVAQTFALVGLVFLVCAVLVAEMFERAICEDLDRHDSYDRGGRDAE